MLSKYSNQDDILFQAVGCVFLCNGLILLLKRNKNKSYPSQWGVPTGKVKEKESYVWAIIREVFEETSIVLSKDEPELVDTYYVIDNDMKFSYTLFYLEFQNCPIVKINSLEHSDFKWCPLNELHTLSLIPHVKDTIQLAIQKKDMDL